MEDYIIKPNDPRFNKLESMWKTCSFDNNVIWRNYRMIDIYIPKELIIRDYIDTREFTQLNGGYLNLRGKHKLTELKESTNLDIQELFDLIVLHINKRSDRPKCAECGKPLPFAKFLYGYGNSCENWNDKPKFCCHKCHARYHHKLGNIGFGTLNNQVSAHRAEFISYGYESDPCYFYIAKVLDEFKYGISSCNKHREFWDGPYKLKPIFYGTRLQVANLEAHVKLNLNSYSERLPFVGLMSEFRKAYLLAIKNINNDPF